MKNLKKILLCGVSLAAVVIFGLSFLAKITLTTMGNVVFQYKNVIWGTTMDNIKLGPAIAPMIGVILILVGGLCIGCMALAGDKLLKKELHVRIAIIAGAVLMMVGGLLLFFTKDSLAAAYCRVDPHVTKQQVLSFWNGMNPKTTVSVILGIVAILVGIAGCGAEVFVKEK